MNKVKLTKKELNIEDDIANGVYKAVNPAELKSIVVAIKKKKKDTVLNVRINSDDLKNLKLKAKKLKIPYQTFISEILHRYAS
ncbi:MAG: hypothetical protein ACD_73C00071G0003 [uncultured bacterium]|nr:MAG: hypothetical protein ACD_73C00071G0003 [uncultured bacterium]